MCLDEDGFYQFGSLGGTVEVQPSVERDMTIDFMFDGTGSREWGVYIVSWPEGNKIKYCTTFLEWLQFVIEAKGQIFARRT